MTDAHPPGGSGLVLLLADLDDSCFQTERKCPPQRARRAAAWDRQGEPVSFQLPSQIALLDLLAQGALLIPVTGRNRSALDRTIYHNAPYAITSFGGSIHTPAGLDVSWSARRTIPITAELHAMYDAVAEAVRALGLPLRCRLVEESDGPQYVSIKALEADEPPFATLLAHLAAWHALPPQWHAFRTDRSLAITPPHLGKEQAVAHFLTHHAPPHACTIGLGDGLADLAFLSLCDFAMTPRDSHLQQALQRLHPR